MKKKAKQTSEKLITQRSLFYWVLRKHRGIQLILLLIILASLFFRVFPLEMQRRIINEAIHLKDEQLLFLYCGLYIGAVILAGVTKYIINVMQTILGQRILVELRTELYEHILQLPLQFYRKMQPGTVISAMTAELNSIGFFLGGAVTIPIASILTFVVFIGFMFTLSPLLALLSMGIYPFELIIIPLLQKKYNRLNKERIKTTRAMANVVNESISGIHEIHANGGYGLEKKRISEHIAALYELLKRLFVVKYGIKFANNLFQSFGPFILFLVGGYLAIHGQFTLGALVAFLSAYEKVYDPWKEMLEYYQSLQDARIRYSQIMRIFNLEPPHPMLPTGREIVDIQGGITMDNCGFSVGSGVRLLNNINLEINPCEQVALVGFSGSGKSTLALVMAQLYDATSGSTRLDNHDIAGLSKADVSGNITMIAQHPFIFSGTIRDNLLYGILAQQQDFDQEPVSREALVQVVEEVGLTDDIIRFGLHTILNPQQRQRFQEKILRMREIVRDRLRTRLVEEIEFYEYNNFLSYSSIAENIVFGDSHDDRFSIENLLTNSHLMELLKESGLETQLLELGHSLVEQTVSLVHGSSLDKVFGHNPSTPVLRKEFQKYSELSTRFLDTDDTLGDKDQQMLLVLALRYAPGFHTVIMPSARLQKSVVEVRHRFLREIAGVQVSEGTTIHSSPDVKLTCTTGIDGFTPCCPELYFTGHSILENILFGTVKSGEERLSEPLRQLAHSTFAKEGLIDEVIDIGLDFDVGSKGDHLSGGQQQKLAIGRAFLRDTPILVMDEATASLDNASQARIQRVIDSRFKGKKTIISVIHRLELTRSYDRIYVLKNGLIVESGTYSQLMEAHGAFYKLATQQ